MCGPSLARRVGVFVDDVLTRLERVEVEQVLKSRTKLWVAVLNERTAEVEIRNPKCDGVPHLLMLKAAVAIPVVYGRSVMVGGESYLDAGFVQPFPLSAAIDAGCTDVLVVTAQTAGFRSSPTRWWQRELFNRRCARENPQLRALYRSSAEAQNCQRRLADGTDSSGDVNIATLAPVDVRIGPTTTDPRRLRAEMIRMCERVLNVFGASNQGLERLIEGDVV